MIERRASPSEASILIIDELLEPLIKREGGDLFSHLVEVDTNRVSLELDTQAVVMALLAAADHECSILKDLDYDTVLLVRDIPHASAVALLPLVDVRLQCGGSIE